jgi:hypothetical protein
MECDIFHNSLIDQNDLIKQAQEETADEDPIAYSKALYGSFTDLLNNGDAFEYLGENSVKSKIPKYTATKY